MSTTTLSPVQIHRTWLAAQHHGGGFISALAAAWLRADATNRARLTAAFPEVVERFGPGTGFYPSEAEL